MVGGSAKNEANKKIIKSLGGRVIDDIEDHFDVYICDPKLIRNCKLLMAISVKAHIVNA